MAGPLLNGLRRVGGFLFNYARKATATGGIGAALVPTLLASLPEDAPDNLLSQVAAWPVYVQVAVFFGVFFATTYFPPNKSTASS